MRSKKDGELVFDKVFNKSHVNDLGSLTSSIDDRNVKCICRIRVSVVKEPMEKIKKKRSGWT